MTDKQSIYLTNMQRSLVEVYNQIEQLLITIPDDCDESVLTTEQWDNIKNVQALESEWILDDEMRREMTCIDWIDDD
jgi:hypothetical protein